MSKSAVLRWQVLAVVLLAAGVAQAAHVSMPHRQLSEMNNNDNLLRRNILARKRNRKSKGDGRGDSQGRSDDSHESNDDSDAEGKGSAFDFQEQLQPMPNAVFTGHEHCDSDSLGSSMGLAHLLGSENVAICMAGPTQEMQYVMEYFNISMPPKTNDPKWEGMDWVLTDHNEAHQIPEGVDTHNIKMIVDHHRFGSGTVDQKQAIFIRARAWGSASTVVTFLVKEQGQEVPRGQIAGALLAGILSDTFNLVGPTSTKYDRIARDYLSERAGITDIDSFAWHMFDAKSNLGNVSIAEIIELDAKYFVMHGSDIWIGVEETVHATKTEEQLDEYITAITTLKQRDNLDYAFYYIVDIITQTGKFIVIDNGPGSEGEVIADVWDGEFTNNDRVYATEGHLTSRKLNLVPPLTDYFENK